MNYSEGGFDMATRTIHLHGQLGRLFGKKHHFVVKDVAEAIRCMCYQFKATKRSNGKSFREYFEKRKRIFAIVLGNWALKDIKLMKLQLGSIQDIHIVPRARGAKSGFFTFLLGIAIVGAAFLGPFGALTAAVDAGAGIFGTATALTLTGKVALFGGILAAGGVSQILAPTPDVGNGLNRERPEDRPSFMLNQFVNKSKEGGPVPIAYGEVVMIGSHVVSAGISTRTLSIFQTIDQHTDADFIAAFFPAAETIVDPITPFETITSRDFNGLKWWGSPGPHPDFNTGTEANVAGFHGVRDPGSFKVATIWRVAEYHITDGASGFQRVQLVLSGNLPQDYFVALTITDQPDTTIYHNLNSVDADSYFTTQLQGLGPSSSGYWEPRYENQPHGGFTKWVWDIETTATPNFVIPLAQLRLLIEYNN